MNRADSLFVPNRTAKLAGLQSAIAIERRAKWRNSVKRQVRQASPATLSRIINVGLQSESDVLRLDPCIPKAWSRFEMTIRFLSAHSEIRVENPCCLLRGCRRNSRWAAVGKSTLWLENAGRWRHPSRAGRLGRRATRRKRRNDARARSECRSHCTSSSGYREDVLPCATAVLRKCCQRRVAAGNRQARLPV